MSAEAFAEEKFNAATRNPDFVNRVTGLGVPTSDVVVVADSTPVGEVLARVGSGAVIAVLDEDSPHGFMLAQVPWVDR